MQIVLAALIGLAFGHAVALAFPRFYSDEPILGPAYVCPSCRGSVPRDFWMPLVGFLVVRGRCSACQSQLPTRLVALPIGGAVLFSTSAVVYDEVVPAVLGGFFATAFLALAIADLERRLLPNRIIYPALVVAVAVSWAWPESSAWEVLAGGLVALGIAAALLLIALPFGSQAVGMGDIKMILLMGFVVGAPAILVGAFIGTLAAAVGAAILLVTRVRRMGDYIPHGPFLALGAIIALFWGNEIWDAYRG